jgi:hypothetical protein
MELPAYEALLEEEENVGQKPNFMRVPSWGHPANLDVSSSHHLILKFVQLWLI